MANNAQMSGECQKIAANIRDLTAELADIGAVRKRLWERRADAERHLDREQQLVEELRRDLAGGPDIGDFLGDAVRLAAELGRMRVRLQRNLQRVGRAAQLPIEFTLETLQLETRDQLKHAEARAAGYEGQIKRIDEEVRELDGVQRRKTALLDRAGREADSHGCGAGVLVWGG